MSTVAGKWGRWGLAHSDGIHFLCEIRGRCAWGERKTKQRGGRFDEREEESKQLLWWTGEEPTGKAGIPAWLWELKTMKWLLQHLRDWDHNRGLGPSHLYDPSPTSTSGTHQVLPSGSNSFRICNHCHLPYLFWSFTFVPETVWVKLHLCPFFPLSHTSLGHLSLASPTTQSRKLFFASQLNPGTGNDWFTQRILGKLALYFSWVLDFFYFFYYYYF